MSRYNTVLFDLDGTLTDSSLGITRCAAMTLDHYGIAYDSLDALRVFIGPPLSASFPAWGVPAEETDNAIRLFRSRYTTVGKFENAPYDGISDLLIKLKKEGYRLIVATSKPESVAAEILDKFELSQYFDRICGASADHSRETKDAVISYVLAQEKSDIRPVMVGDTSFDVTGAGVHHIDCIGVLWGFGTEESMIAAGACGIADSMQSLYELITQ